jgi:hypothetical protein
MRFADRAFAFATLACEKSPACAAQFLREWPDVASFAELLERNGSEITGLSHALEDDVSLGDLRSLINLSGLRSEELRDRLELDWANQASPHGGQQLSPVVPTDADQQQAMNNADAWLAAARPILEKISGRFETMRWTEAGPAADADRFESDIKALKTELPILPEPVDMDKLGPELDRHLKKTIWHGTPIPDEYSYCVLAPKPGDMWGSLKWGEPRRVAACLQIGLFVAVHVLEGYGRLSPGVLVEPEVKFADK